MYELLKKDNIKVFSILAVPDDKKFKYSMGLNYTANKVGVFIEYLQTEQKWQGFYYNKVVLLLNDMKKYYQEGIRYFILTDSRDVFIRYGLDTILSKMRGLPYYDKIVFNQDFSSIPVFPCDVSEFREKMTSEFGGIINSGLLCGRLDKFIELLELVKIEYQRYQTHKYPELLKRCGGHLAGNDQFYYQLTAINNPGLIAVDVNRELFAVCEYGNMEKWKNVDNVLENWDYRDAAFIHLPGQRYTFDFAVDNNMIEDVLLPTREMIEEYIDYENSQDIKKSTMGGMITKAECMYKNVIKESPSTCKGMPIRCTNPEKIKDTRYAINRKDDYLFLYEAYCSTCKMYTVYTPSSK